MSAKRKHSDDYGTPGFVCVCFCCVCAACRRHCSGLSLPKSGVPYAHAWPILNFFTPQVTTNHCYYYYPTVRRPLLFLHPPIIVVDLLLLLLLLPAAITLATYFRQAFPSSL